MITKSEIKIFISAAVMIFCTTLLAFATEGGEDIGNSLPIWSIIPFVGMLLSIAIFPLVKPEWWEENQLWVALFWAACFLVPFGIVYGGHHLLYEMSEMILGDYLTFIVLLFGLFVAAGGIALKGSLVGTTKVNCILLIIGTLLSSWVGTTGSAMLMIRPIIKANAWREKKAHVIIFFIFTVANLGGCLTPVGDPPLFLGFLRGVPFFWTMRIFPIMCFNAAILLIVFAILDQKLAKKEIAQGRKPEDMITGEREKIHIEGAHNFLFVAMIVGAVILTGILAKPENLGTTGIDVFGYTFQYCYMIQVAIILVAAFLSMKTTKKEIREFNGFTFAPIAEVAKLFIGIFLTMIPALALLRTHGASLGLSNPWQFFWITGALSSFLDNAPTYLVFMTTAGSLGATEGLATAVGTIAEKLLLAISCGAVFMGANTYIGNAPNFMVKSIAEENKIKMPSFFGYMKWSLLILIPTFLIDTFVFFR